VYRSIISERIHMCLRQLGNTCALAGHTGPKLLSCSRCFFSWLAQVIHIFSSCG
jgi:hypothetical protein